MYGFVGHVSKCSGKFYNSGHEPLFSITILHMFRRSWPLILGRCVAYAVIVYGLSIIAGSLLHELDLHGRHRLDEFILTVPVLIGISYVYLGTLLLRRKYNAWLTTVILSAAVFVFNLAVAIRPHLEDEATSGRFNWWRALVAAIVLIVLWLSRSVFRVRSDMRSFQQAARMSVLVLLVALVYGVGGFTLLDKHDFHQEISFSAAIHQTVDQFGLTTTSVVPYTRRAHFFLDSLSVLSTAAVAYAAVSFFQPLRMRLSSEARHREQAERLLKRHPADVDEFFKLWPHDKHYYFDAEQRAGLAYHVASGVALIVGDPFGDPTRYRKLLLGFLELCFVNDWQPMFVHISDQYRKLYERLDFRLQKLGEEAVLDVDAFQAIRDSKYFRQIRNRFVKLGYQVELLEPPHNAAVLQRLRLISEEWLTRPGRSERGLMMGYYSEEYMQQGPVAVVRDEAQTIQGFVNLVPSFLPRTANYDLLRCSQHAPGNCNDFLLLGLLDILYERGVKTFNLGLCPLSGLEEQDQAGSVIDTALRFVYANGDRFYSFSGIRRFKAKYEPQWHGRYVAYRGGIRGFTRAMTALTRAMKVK